MLVVDSCDGKHEEDGVSVKDSDEKLLAVTSVSNDPEIIGNNVNFRPPNVVDRYFKRRYKNDVLNKIGEDQMILTHSNRVCVICLAESHPVVSEKKTVTSVSFENAGWNRLENKFSGKSKRGAQWLDGNSPLCVVTCADGSIYTLCCCIKGQLIEVNEKLIKQPELLMSKHSGEGYVAVILPGLKGFDREIAQLKSESEYRAAVASRTGSLK